MIETIRGSPTAAQITPLLSRPHLQSVLCCRVYLAPDHVRPSVHAKQWPVPRGLRRRDIRRLRMPRWTDMHPLAATAAADHATFKGFDRPMCRVTVNVHVRGDGRSRGNTRQSSGHRCPACWRGPSAGQPETSQASTSPTLAASRSHSHRNILFSVWSRNNSVTSPGGSHTVLRSWI